MSTRSFPIHVELRSGTQVVQVKAQSLHEALRFARMRYPGALTVPQAADTNARAAA